MNRANDQIPREVIERRLLDRYVNVAGDEARAVFVGRGGRAGWKAAVASKALGAWPRIKAIPVIGSIAYRMFTWIRKSGG